MTTTTTTATTSRAYTRDIPDIYSYRRNDTNKHVFLRARPYARAAGHLMLVPLLPMRPPLPPLPVEVWRKVIRMIIDDEEVRTSGSVLRSGAKQKEKQNGSGKGKLNSTSNLTKKWSRWYLALVCKEMKVCFLSIFLYLSLLYQISIIIHAGTCFTAPLLSLRDFILVDTPKVHHTSTRL